MDTELTASVATFRIYTSGQQHRAAPSLASDSRHERAPPSRNDRMAATLVTEGPLILSRLAKNEMSYLQVNNFTRAIMPRSQIWRVSDTELVVPASFTNYWLITLSGPRSAVLRLDNILRTLCKYDVIGEQSDDDLLLQDLENDDWFQRAGGEDASNTLPAPIRKPAAAGALMLSQARSAETSSRRSRSASPAQSLRQPSQPAGDLAELAGEPAGIASPPISPHSMQSPPYSPETPRTPSSPNYARSTSPHKKLYYLSSAKRGDPSDKSSLHVNLHLSAVDRAKRDATRVITPPEMDVIEMAIPAQPAAAPAAAAPAAAPSAAAPLAASSLNATLAQQQLLAQTAPAQPEPAQPEPAQPGPARPSAEDKQLLGTEAALLPTLGHQQGVPKLLDSRFGPRFSHPLIPSSCVLHTYPAASVRPILPAMPQRVSLHKRELLAVGPNSLHQDVSTVGGYIGLKAVNKIFRKT